MTAKVHSQSRSGEEANRETWARYWTHWYERHSQEAAEAKALAEGYGASFHSEIGKQSLPSADGRGQPWEVAEKCAEIAEQVFGGKSHKVSENSDTYAIQDHAVAQCAAAIRAYAATLKGKP